jgi:hypothetical protein
LLAISRPQLVVAAQRAHRRAPSPSPRLAAAQAEAERERVAVAACVATSNEQNCCS